MKGISFSPPKLRIWLVLIFSIFSSILVVSIVVKSSPFSPYIPAISVPCPIPVLAREPKNSRKTSFTSATDLSLLIILINAEAAFHGPIVCELDGPIPTLMISKTDIDSINKSTYSSKTKIHDKSL